MLPVPSDHRGMSLEDDIKKLSSWQRRAPKFTTFRVNCLVTTSENFLGMLKQSLAELSESRAMKGVESSPPPVWQNPLLPEAVAFGTWVRNNALVRHELEVIVDPACGEAVLRGAHVFVPGVIGLLPGASKGDIVSIYADLGNSCKRGWTQKLDKEHRFFVGNGTLLIDRKQIFCKNGIKQGVAVHVTDNDSGCPSLSPNSFPPGTAVMQNLPSIICGRVLDPHPGELILDMCAAPGNKTSHLAALMENQGIIIALDRSSSRIKKLRQLCKDLSVKNVFAFVFNSVLALEVDKEPITNRNDCLHLALMNGPPFPPNVFDRILLDAPCSGLGQRPKLEKIDLQHVATFPPLQKKLFETAVKLLKPGGTLVYSTCTVVQDENEGVVRWALDHFPCLHLVPAEPRFQFSACPQDSSSILLSSEMNSILKFVPRFDNTPEDNLCERDTIGFFIARFMKRV